MQAFETFELENGCSLKLYQDEDPMSPLDWDTGTHLWIGSRDWGSNTDSAPPLGRSAYSEESIRFGIRYLTLMEGCAALPVFFADYGSSGARMYVTDAESANGIIWSTPDDIRMTQGETAKLSDPGMPEQMERMLRGQVEEWDQYLQGDVYGYVVEDASGEILDSCWGFYGWEYAVEEAKAAGEAAAASEAADRAWAERQGIPTELRSN